MPCITAHHNSTQLQNCTSTCRLNYFLWSDYCCCCFFIINFWKQIYHFLTDAAVVIIILCLAYVLPWYNCTGWRGVKHQVTYLLAWHTTNGWQTYTQNSKHMSRLRTSTILKWKERTADPNAYFTRPSFILSFCCSSCFISKVAATPSEPATSAQKSCHKAFQASSATGRLHLLPIYFFTPILVPLINTSACLANNWKGKSHMLI